MSHSIHVGGDAEKSILVTGSHNVVVQAEHVLFATAQAARRHGRDPAQMLRILALLAAPVFDPDHPDQIPPPLDLKQEWHELARGLRASHAPILLARIVPPTPDALRRACSPRAEAQALFPHVLHFSGHAWRGGLLLEDEHGRVHRTTTPEILGALRGLPRPFDLVVLNGCESAADARSVAQALVDAGLARAAVGHTRPVADPEAIRFAARLYADLADGFPLKDAVARAQRAVTTHEVALLGEESLRFERFTGGEPWIDDRRPRGNLPSRLGDFFGRGRELVEIAEALARPPAVVLLSGPAAIGKSVLALEAAHRNAWRFPGGVAFAEGPRPEEGRPATAEELLAHLAGALGLTPGQVAEALVLHTSQTPTLLILDNLETLPPDETARLARVLERLGGESAAILLARRPVEAVETLPHALSISLHEGLEAPAALYHAARLAERKRLSLRDEQVAAIVRAAGGHPRLIELLVALARRRDLQALLAEVREGRGDFQAQLATLYEWSARVLDERGQLGAWQALLLFPAGAAPEALLREAAGEGGVQALRDAALADFDSARQVWRWHATVSDYARSRWPLYGATRRARLAALLPTWTAWLKTLPPETAEGAARLETQQANLRLLLADAGRLPAEDVRAFRQALHRAAPAPDRTLTLRPFLAEFYRGWAEQATDDTEQAWALGMLGYALAALGRREEALEATQEAVEHYRRLAEAHPEAFLPDLAGSLNNLGRDLAALGRREEALEATQEAVALYRELAQAHPEAFLPDLATSLNNLGDCLAEMQRFQEALDAYEEAVRLLAPFFRRLPQAFAERMSYMLRDYLRACEAAGKEPDRALVEEIERVMGEG